jgi:hypothetical protein
MSASPVVIATFANELEAHVARAVLDAHGIPSMLLRDDAGGMQIALSYLRGVRLAVRHADAVRALRLLEVEDPEAPDTEQDAAS